MIVYFMILSIVLIYQLTRINNTVSAPSNNGAVLAEDRLNNAVVFYDGSCVVLSNKKQMLLDRTNPSYTPIMQNGTAYLPASFYSTVYGANVNSNKSTTSATIRLENKALVIDSNEATLVDNSNEKELELTSKPIVYQNTVCIPADVFAEAFNKKFYLYGSMGILSADEFTEADNTFLNGLVSQVNDLPFVVNEENLKSVAGIKGTDDIFSNIEARKNQYINDEIISPVDILTEQSCSNIAESSGYIYYGATGEIQVINSVDDTVTSEIPLDPGFKAESLILNEDKLIVLGGSNEGSSGIFIFNISNPAAVTPVRQYNVSGFYKNAVLSGEYIYLLSQNSVYSLYKDGHFTEPSYTDSTTGVMPLSYEGIQYFPEIGYDDFTIISAININNTQAPNCKGFVGAGDNIYLSRSNLYISKDRNTAFDNYENIENTCIYRYTLSNGAITSTGQVNIKGHLINSQAISEDNGYCRVVTKFTDSENNSKPCNVYVINNNLEICGEATELASDEDISYAIFYNKKILLTPANTGGNIYGIDIEDPTLPKGIGTLNLSRGNLRFYYYDETSVLAIDDGDDVLKIRLYDVDDFASPKKLFSQDLGRNDTITSQLFSNKGGFLFDKDKNIMTVPVKITNDNNTMFDGVYVYNVYKDEGITRIGTLMIDDGGLNCVYKYNGKLYMFNNNGAVVADTKEVSILSKISFDENIEESTTEDNT